MSTSIDQPEQQNSNTQPTLLHQRKEIYKLIIPEVFKETFNNREAELKWKSPAADITDYFNYGFCETTFRAYANKVRTYRGKFPISESYDENKYGLNKMHDRTPLEYGGLCNPFDEELLSTEQSYDPFLKDQFIEVLLEDYIDNVSQLMKFAQQKTDILGFVQNRNLLTRFVLKHDEDQVEKALHNEQMALELGGGVNMSRIPYGFQNLSYYAASKNYAEYKKNTRKPIDFIALQHQIMHNISQKNNLIHANHAEKVYFLDVMQKDDPSQSSMLQRRTIGDSSSVTSTVSSGPTTFTGTNPNNAMKTPIPAFAKQNMLQQQQQYQLQQFFLNQFMKGMPNGNGVFPVNMRQQQGLMMNAVQNQFNMHPGSMYGGNNYMSNQMHFNQNDMSFHSRYNNQQQSQSAMLMNMQQQQQQQNGHQKSMNNNNNNNNNNKGSEERKSKNQQNSPKKSSRTTTEDKSKPKVSTSSSSRLKSKSPTSKSSSSTNATSNTNNNGSSSSNNNNKTSSTSENSSKPVSLKDRIQVKNKNATTTPASQATSSSASSGQTKLENKSRKRSDSLSSSRSRSRSNKRQQQKERRHDTAIDEGRKRRDKSDERRRDKSEEKNSRKRDDSKSRKTSSNNNNNNSSSNNNNNNSNKNYDDKRRRSVERDREREREKDRGEDRYRNQQKKESDSNYSRKDGGDRPSTKSGAAAPSSSSTAPSSNRDKKGDSSINLTKRMSKDSEGGEDRKHDTHPKYFMNYFNALSNDNNTSSKSKSKNDNRNQRQDSKSRSRSPKRSQHKSQQQQQQQQHQQSYYSNKNSSRR